MTSLEQIRPKLLSVEHYAYDKNWPSILHSHSFTELSYVVSGKGKFMFFDGYSVNVKSDDMIIIDPNILHTEISNEEDPLVYIVVGVSGMHFITTNQDYHGYSLHNFKEFKHDVLFYLRCLIEEFKDKDSYFDTVCDHLLSMLIINIVRRTEVSLEVKQFHGDGKPECIFVENYINTHYMDDITLDQLANLTFFNKYYLSHIFKAYSGYSPIEFLIRKRIHEAKKLISRTDHSITDITKATGFSNPSHFSSYFKKHVGCTPTQYKKSNESPNQ